MKSTPPPAYQARVVPALHRIQRAHGYLKREELERFAKEAGLPECKMQAVASFFPHFRLSPPPLVTIRVCRDMACHMAGSADRLRALGRLAQGLPGGGDRVRVEGTSCLGRCDRAPAMCVSLHRRPQPGTTESAGEEERYYLGRSAGDMGAILTACLEGSPPAADHDADLQYRSSDWVIDPYRGMPSTYAAVRRALAARDASLRKAAELLQAQAQWTRDRTERFRAAAGRRLLVNFALDDKIRAAVRAWQTASDWAAGPDLGNWADPLLDEMGGKEEGKDDLKAHLRGMGGAGIRATQKWRDVREAVRHARKRKAADDRAFIVVNGDESEPATFKDRELLLRAPHLVVEGVILAGLFTEATEGFIYIRHEYHEQIEAVEREIRRAEELGVCGKGAWALGRSFPVSVFVSPGGYICGEQSALIEAMSDRRAEPRNMPPKLETNGLDDRPTLVSNVETFAWVPFVIKNGGQAYAEAGTKDRTSPPPGKIVWRGRRFFSVCGDVNRPGVYEVRMGMTLRQLICGERYCNGIVGGKRLKAIAPSGPSGGFLPAVLKAGAGLPKGHTTNKVWLDLARRHGFDPQAQELDVLDLELELDVFRALSPTQALGAGLVVYAEGRDMADQAVNAIQFFRNESCGKCVPCRIGSQKLATLGENLLAGGVGARRSEELLPGVVELGVVMEMTSICGLGRSVPVPLKTVLQFFPDDLTRHLTADRRGGEADDGVLFPSPEMVREAGAEDLTQQKAGERVQGSGFRVQEGEVRG